MDRLDRRRLLRLSGAVGAATLAGCFGSGDDGNNSSNDSPNGTSNNESDGDENATLEAGSVPSYASFISDETVYVAYTDQVALENAIDSDGMFRGGDLQSEPDYNSLVNLVGRTAAVELFGASIALTPFNLDTLVSTEGSAQFETELEELITLDDTLVATGDIDADEIERHVQAVGDDTSLTEYERDGEVGSYVLYTEIEGSGTGGNSTYTIGDAEIDTIGIGETTALMSSRANVERVAEAAADSTRVSETSDPLRWLLSTGVDADIAIGNYNPEGIESGYFESDDLPESVMDANGFLGSASFDGDTMAAQMAAVFPEPVSADQRDAIEEMAGEDANDHSTTVDGTRVLLSATYDTSVLTTSPDE
jgi:hypothetical protein